MIIRNVFDAKVVIHHCNDTSLYNNKTVKNSIDFVFSIDEIRDSIDQSQLGNAFSTCNYFDKFPLTKMPGTEHLSEWVAQRILESASVFDFHHSTKIGFERTWINLMFYGCEGSCHSHPLDVDGVAIFYPKVPSNGSQLVFIRNGVVGSTISQYSEDDLAVQPVITGDLVIHDPKLPHAVSKHNSHDSRICFIYEFKYY